MHTRVELKRSAILHNIRTYRSIAPDSLFMAVIKSNAYGHGLERFLEVLPGHVDWYGVNSVYEAAIIRRYDEHTPVLVMGRFNQSEIQQFIHQLTNVHYVVSTIEDIQELDSLHPGASFHLKVDTGMSRLGTRGDEFESILQFLREHPDLRWSGLMTHFANVEDVSDQSYARNQLERFEEACTLARSSAGDRQLLMHAAASAATMVLPGSRMDMIRVGISLYGLWASTTTRLSLLGLTGSVPELAPVLRWITSVVHINEVPRGTSVGYGCTYRTQTHTRIAVLPVGYFEGYNRGYSNRAHVIIRGIRARVLGRVCMNMTMVDVTHIPHVAVGDEAVLIGNDGEESVSAEELSSLVSTINYETVTVIQRDIPRILVD